MSSEVFEERITLKKSRNSNILIKIRTSAISPTIIIIKRDIILINLRNFQKLNQKTSRSLGNLNVGDYQP